MKFARRTCVELHCDGGCENKGWDDGPPHFATATEALDYARAYAWTFPDGSALCHHCTADAECRDRGHRWDLWHQRQDMGVAYRKRFCTHCSADETDPPFDVLCEQVRAVRDAEDILRAAAS